MGGCGLGEYDSECRLWIEWQDCFRWPRNSTPLTEGEENRVTEFLRGAPLTQKSITGGWECVGVGGSVCVWGRVGDGPSMLGLRRGGCPTCWRPAPGTPPTGSRWRRRAFSQTTLSRAPGQHSKDDICQTLQFFTTLVNNVCCANLYIFLPCMLLIIFYIQDGKNLTFLLEGTSFSFSPHPKKIGKLLTSGTT